MPIPDAPTVARVAMLYTRDTRNFVNTFHVQKDTELVLSDLEAIATEALDWWETEFKQSQPSTIALTQIQVRKYDPDNPLAYDLPVIPPSVGSLAGAVAPGNTTSTLSWRTGLAGKKFRGRIYVPGIRESDTSDDDRIASPLMALLAAAATGFLDRFGLVGSIYKAIVFHRATATGTRIITAVLENIIDSQRRRLPGRGR
jgi:hypothetical protein